MINWIYHQTNQFNLWFIYCCVFKALVGRNTDLCKFFLPILIFLILSKPSIFYPWAQICFLFIYPVLCCRTIDATLFTKGCTVVAGDLSRPDDLFWWKKWICTGNSIWKADDFGSLYFCLFFFFSCTFWLPNLESLLYLTHVYLVLVLNFISSLGRCKASTLVAIARTNDFYNFACDSVSIKSNRWEIRHIHIHICLELYLHRWTIDFVQCKNTGCSIFV